MALRFGFPFGSLPSENLNFVADGIKPPFLVRIQVPIVSNENL
jgi:hypothetical protein